MLSPGNSLFSAPFYQFHFIITMSEILLIFHVSKALFFHWTSHCDVTKCFEDPFSHYPVRDYVANDLYTRYQA